MRLCLFHKYVSLGTQKSNYISINGVPITREVVKCKKCGKIKYIYFHVGFEDSLRHNWYPKINTNDTLKEKRKKKLKKLKRKF